MNNVYLRLLLMSSGEGVTGKVLQWEIMRCLKTVPPGYQILGTILKVKVAQSCPTLCDPMDYTVHRLLQERILEWVAIPFSRGPSNPGIEPRSPTLQADSLPDEPHGKPENTGVGSLFLPQRISQT